MLLDNMNTTQCPTLGPQPHLFETRPPVQGWTFPARRRAEAPRDESTIVASFATWVNSLGPLSQASPALQARILSKVEALARHIDGSVEAGAPSGYDRRVLYEDPERWSIAAVILRAGQHTERHDHGGWGCAVTVQGIERNRRFASDASGALVLSDERDYPPGTGYVFDAVEVHEPLGADQQRVTVALHFLVHEGHAEAHAEASVHELKAA
jgi:predicted metal-dependent enzyme (double-stranded beta helix superfamily)